MWLLEPISTSIVDDCAVVHQKHVLDQGRCLLYHHYATGSLLGRLSLDSMSGKEFHDAVTKNIITATTHYNDRARSQHVDVPLEHSLGDR